MKWCHTGWIRWSVLQCIKFSARQVAHCSALFKFGACSVCCAVHSVQYVLCRASLGAKGVITGGGSCCEEEGGGLDQCKAVQVDQCSMCKACVSSGVTVQCSSVWWWRMGGCNALQTSAVCVQCMSSGVTVRKEEGGRLDGLNWSEGASYLSRCVHSHFFPSSLNSNFEIIFICNRDISQKLRLSKLYEEHHQKHWHR